MKYASKTRKTYEFNKMKPWLGYDFGDEIIARLGTGLPEKELSVCLFHFQNTNIGISDAWLNTGSSIKASF
jgi:hypothetical protein